MYKMKFVKLLALVFVTFSLIFVTSCGKDDGGGGTSEQETIIELLNGNTFSTTAASSTDAAGVTVADVTISFSGNASMTFSLTGGEVDDHAVDGGSFNIAENGSFSGLTLNPAGEEVEVTPGDIVYSSTANTITLTFSTTESSARVGGIGSFTLVFATN